MLHLCSAHLRFSMYACLSLISLHYAEQNMLKRVPETNNFKYVFSSILSGCYLFWPHIICSILITVTFWINKNPPTTREQRLTVSQSFFTPYHLLFPTYQHTHTAVPLSYCLWTKTYLFSFVVFVWSAVSLGDWNKLFLFKGSNIACVVGIC